MMSGSFKKRHLAALLVGDGQDVLELCVAISELVATTLFGFYSLSASGFFTGVGEILCIVDAHDVFVVRVA